MKSIGIILVFVLACNNLFAQHSQIQKSMKENTFDQQLENLMERANVYFNDVSYNFGINVATKHAVLFQIIKRTLLEGVNDKEFGFGIHLSFDDSFSETKSELERFMSSDIIKLFKYHSWDGIDTYQLDLKDDTTRIKALAKKIVVEVYNKNITEIEIDLFEI